MTPPRIIKKRNGWFGIIVGNLLGWPFILAGGFSAAFGLMGLRGNPEHQAITYGNILLGAILILIGSAIVARGFSGGCAFSCSECGNPVAKTSKLCPTCSARLQ